MIPPFDSSVVGVLEKVRTPGFLGSYSCSFRVSPARTAPTDVPVSLRLDPAAEITSRGVGIIFQAGICQRSKIFVAMRLGVPLDGRNIHGMVCTA